MPRAALRNVILVLILTAAGLLGTGLVGPCMTIVPSLGEWDSWVRLLKPSAVRPSEYSVLSGIMTMIQGNNVGLGLLLLAFSAAFPTLKLAVMAWAASALGGGRGDAGLHGRVALAFVHHAGKFSMLDVMVLAMIVIALKGLPGNTRVELGWGVWAFAGSVVVSLVASVLLQRLEKQSTALSDPSPAGEEPEKTT
jgi:paraquat-inducible protein A